MGRLALAALAASVALSPALAYPDGAPWGAADPDGAETCASCHFDQDAVMASDAIRLEGAPAEFAPSEVYQLVVRFAPPNGAAVAGFLATASAGEMRVNRSEAAGALEANGAEIRSTEPVDAGGEIAWRFDWRAPGEAVGSVRFFIGANAANGDESSFGDVIHYQEYTVRR